MVVRITDNLTNQLDSIMWIFQFTGLQYFNIDIPCKNSLKQKARNFPKAPIFLFFLMIVVLFNFVFYYFNKRNYNSESKVDIIAAVLEKLADESFFVTAYVTIIQSYRTKHTEAKLYDKIFIISSKMGFICQYNHKLDAFLRHTKVKMGFLLIFDICSFLSVITLDYFKIINEGTYNWKFVYFSMLVCKLISLKFILLVDLMRFFLEELRGHLEKFDDHSIKVVKVIDIYALRLHASASGDTLAGIKEIYEMIWECSQMINKCLGLSILILIVSTCFNISLTAYYEFKFSIGLGGHFFNEGKINIKLE